ncbi:hypothetical protein GGR52DRAFT_565584 [Hypoxylon sp. FL1284]|nr:hypothetical protein GGR52DRAFT_565584 [Hypoxylon sp. FL1284]
MATKTVHVTLNPIDHFPPGNYATFSFYLPLKHGVTYDEAYAVLQEGLHRTFVQVPWASGKVYPQSPDTPGWRPGQLEIRYEPVDPDEPWTRELRFNELKTSSTYAELRELGFPLATFRDEEVMWAAPLPDVKQGAECFVAQANFLPGGCIVTSAACHYACDGTSYFNLVQLWAAHCYALQPGKEAPPRPSDASSDRDLIDRIWMQENTGNPITNIKPASYGMFDLPLPGSEPAPAVDSYKEATAGGKRQSMQAASFYMSSEDFMVLQKDCNRQLGPSSRLSGNDAVCGLVWRCLLKARQAVAGISSNEIKAKLYLTLDARPDFSQALPMTYLGNLSVMNLCSLPLSSLTAADTTAAAVAQTIREVAETTNTASLMDAWTLARSMDDFSKLTLRGSSIHAFDMLISSFLAYPQDSVCWGGKAFGRGGRPDAFRPLMDGFNRFSRLCFLMPRKRHGGVELVLNLFDDEMKLLLEDEEFTRYASYMTS